jgi:hypothetical protein
VHIYTHRVNYIFLPPTVQSINLQIFIYFSSTGAAGKSVAGTLEPIASRLDREASAVGDKRERAVRFDGYFPGGGDNRADDVAEAVILHSGAAFWLRGSLRFPVRNKLKKGLTYFFNIGDFGQTMIS